MSSIINKKDFMKEELLDYSFIYFEYQRIKSFNLNTKIKN